MLLSPVLFSVHDFTQLKIWATNSISIIILCLYLLGIVLIIHFLILRTSLLFMYKFRIKNTSYFGITIWVNICHSLILSKTRDCNLINRIKFFCNLPQIYKLFYYSVAPNKTACSSDILDNIKYLSRLWMIYIYIYSRTLLA